MRVSILEKGGRNGDAPPGCPGGASTNPAMTYSRPRRTTIGPGCLTAVFGMGTGVAIRVCSPGSRPGAGPQGPGAACINR